MADDSFPVLRIRNWRRFQQYKDRNPPWIKLHRELLQSEDWVLWSDDSRLLAVVCMLLASRTENGQLPCSNPVFIQRVAYLDRTPDLQPLIDCGFLELDGDASGMYGMLAKCTTETEAETETETETEGENTVQSRSIERVEHEFEHFWNLFPRKQAKKRTWLAWKNLTAENRRKALEALPHHVATWEAEKRDKTKIPLPTTWLNGERWEDELGGELEDAPRDRSKPGWSLAPGVYETLNLHDQEMIREREGRMEDDW